MNDFIELMLTRRTIRRFKEEQIKEVELESILTAGLYAPTAGGSQSATIVVSQDPILNLELGQISRNAENTSEARMGRVSSEQPSIVDDASIKSAFYGAPTVCTIFAKKDIYNFTGDAFTAAQNMILAAHSLGIGACIVGRCDKTFATDRGKEIQAS